MTAVKSIQLAYSMCPCIYKDKPKIHIQSQCLAMCHSKKIPEVRSWWCSSAKCVIKIQMVLGWDFLSHNLTLNADSIMSALWPNR